MKIVVASKSNRYSKNLVNILKDKYGNDNILYLQQQLYSDDLLNCELQRIKPHWIFFFHWSRFIPKQIFENYKCVTLHTGNLPKERGGSPIQNSILNGVKFSRVNAIVTSDVIDSGDIYCSKDISLQGSLSDIWLTITEATYELIIYCVENNPIPTKQTGDSKTFKRRKNNHIVFENNSLEQIYDQIRILDDDQYPSAHIILGNYILEFNRAKLMENKILSDVKIIPYEI